MEPSRSNPAVHPCVEVRSNALGQRARKLVGAHQRGPAPEIRCHATLPVRACFSSAAPEDQPPRPLPVEDIATVTTKFPRNQAAIAGIGATEFSKDSEASVFSLAARAVKAAVADAGLGVEGHRRIGDIRAQ